MTMALELHPETFRHANRKADRHLFRGEQAFDFARTISQFLDQCAAKVVNSAARSLERDIIMMRGIRASLNDFDSAAVLDPKLELNRSLNKLGDRTERFHAQVSAALGQGQTAAMTKTAAANRALAQRLAAMYDAVTEVKWALAEHDADVQSKDKDALPAYAAEDIEKLIADLKS